MSCHISYKHLSHTLKNTVLYMLFIMVILHWKQTKPCDKSIYVSVFGNFITEHFGKVDFWKFYS